MSASAPDSPPSSSAPPPASWLGQRDHYENFPVASWLVPADLRPAMLAVYRFARYGDDVADEGIAPPQERLQELNALRQALRGERNHPIVANLHEAIGRHKIEIELFEALLTAFEQDAQGYDYSSRPELLKYCEHSANPVGRIVLRIFDADDPAALAPSDAICSALQLINFAQDIGQDISRGRCYVPRTELDALGLAETDLNACVRAKSISPPVRRLLDGQLDMALSLLQQGSPLLKMTSGRLKLELASIVAAGYTMLNKTRLNDPFARRLKLGQSDFPVILWQCCSLLRGRPLR